MRRVLVPAEISGQPPAATSSLHRFGGASMGTSWSVQLFGAGGRPDPALELGIARQLALVVEQMSHWVPQSDLSRFNSAAPGSWHALPPAFYKVLACAEDVARASGGAFDPGAGALVNLWGFGAHGRFDEAGFRAPTAAAVERVQGRARAHRATLDHAARRLLQPGGVALDLSSIAKGYAVDRVADHLITLGVEHYLVEVGGELRGSGMKPDGQPWWVMLEPIEGEGDGGELALALHGLSIATSGDYRRYFEAGGARHAHTIDPRSGWPIKNGVASVSVVHAECMMADALSTALTVLGPVEGMAYAERAGFAARMLVRDGRQMQEHLSTRMRGMLA
ncbi:FAD:protein FMN transferase [Massilia glaciei]|uniref:FAD:protein FMN transferase n=1 Tax=Massilia glaciei TaxID=1524097 RepID=A0A2U2HIG5_9BURK|nr:FAD:protein FMN transferase [Massilia glaciei]PWF46131.1 FAD:protein FMN transferase [Massilia glaciei]